MGKLFDKTLKSLQNKKQSKTTTLSDGDGLGVRVSPMGHIRWQFRYKILGVGKRIDLGDYPEISIHKAREISQQYRCWLAEGYDPKIKRDIVRKKTLNPISVEEALEYWLVEFAARKRKNFEKHRAQFQRHIYPFVGKYPVEQMEMAHWLECFDRIRLGSEKRRPAPVAAGYILQNVKQALRFCRVRDFVNSSVLEDLTISDVGRHQKKRDRLLTEIELGDLYRLVSGDKYSPYYGNLIQLLIFFGARTHEVRLSTWKEWDFNEKLWIVSSDKSKNKEKIMRPIPEPLIGWLKHLKGDSRDDEYILGQLKSAETVSQKGRKLYKELNHKEAWTLHDLRRTFATKLSDLGTQPYVVEKLLGHKLAGIMAIYNLAQYLPEKKTALDLWFEHVSRLNYQAENIVLLRKRQ